MARKNRRAGELTRDADWEPRILAFLCNWCSYAGADLAGVSRIQYPPNVRVIRVPCSGRVSPMFILRALQSGLDGVLVSGCHPGDCHYLTGNYFARRRFLLFKDLLDFCGIEEDRVQFSWVSASEGRKFADVIQRVTERVRQLGPATRMVKKTWTIPDGAPAGGMTA
jgi:coenzyme F420-reducing hydrogenase delta subunit